MRLRVAIPAALTAAALMLGISSPAQAKCTRLAFSVNDYGKDGPTKDAKALLDKYIAQWTAERGIKNYTVGKKDVSCELFLNLIIFDEHTCRAEATVCWPDGGAPKAGPAAAGAPTPGGAPAAAPKAPPAAAPAAKPPAAPPGKAKAAELSQ
jgi:hypothetical protein